MKERTFETGGEILRVGSTVIVFDGNSQREMLITSIGTKRVHINSPGYTAPIPYDRESRQNLQGAYPMYFRTKTEVAEYAKRDAVEARLRNLGMAPGTKGSIRYPVAILEQVADILEANAPK